MPDVTIRVGEGQTVGRVDRMSPRITALLVAEARFRADRAARGIFIRQLEMYRRVLRVFRPTGRLRWNGQR